MFRCLRDVAATEGVEAAAPPDPAILPAAEV